MSFLRRLVPLKAHMKFSLAQMAVEQGQPFKGVAIIESRENFSVDEVRVEVRVHERWDEPGWERDSRGYERQVMRQMSNTRYSQDVPLSPLFELRDGEKKELPVQISVPLFQPTRYGGVISYSLKAVAAVKGRPDVTDELQPVVLPLAPGVTKIIEREVVKVPCKYCGSLIELASGINKCPSCGAPMSI